MDTIEIIPYHHPSHQKVFKSLNEEWISHYFVMEEIDYQVLDFPETYILARGGAIFVALLNGEPLGVCALIKMQDAPFDFELAKMAVSPLARRKNIGQQLVEHAIQYSKLVGAKSIFLETNSKLEPAIALYEKLGFTSIPFIDSPYSRVDIQMCLRLTP